ncbi:MAG: MBOAT family protein [Oscillospiraceae bacterium]|nr:MBOAT family protein [Oscillospiraceae bacterium]
MVFSSVTFLYVFLPLVMLVYYAAPKQLKNLLILVSGVLFYAWGEPVYVCLMLFTTLVDYTAGRLIARFEERPKARLACMVTAVSVNLLLLCIFKYSSFVIANLNQVFGLSLIDPKLPLPIGISFYTFQSMSYTLDMYMRNITVQKNFINYAAYVTLFPQIVAGPIVRYKEVAAELEHRTVTLTKVGEGVGIFLRGLGKKVLLANNIGMLWTTVKASPLDELSVLTAWLGILAFTFQIYFDFSGYSDMAVGMGKMMGFNFPQNFDYPYLSKSISEFWRRWHITLGSWFRSYVYIPMGGNRVGTLRLLRNLLVVWFLTGLWHGASWNFILWGLYFGVLIILERFFLGKYLKKLPAVLQVAYSFLLVVFGWVLFEFDSLGNVGQYLAAMFGGNGGVFFDGQSLYLLTSYLLLLLICAVSATNYPKRLVEKISGRFPVCVRYASPVFEACLLLLCTAFLVNSTYNPFLYFRF